MAPDERWDELARVIADGVEVGSSSRVSVTMTAEQPLEAVHALVTEIYRRGAIPQVLYADERFDRAALRHAPLEVLQHTPELEAQAMHWADAHIALRSMLAPDPRLEQVDDQRLGALRASKGRISALRWEATRWCIVRLPHPQWAELLGIRNEELLDEFLRGCLVDWPAAKRDWTELAEQWGRASSARILSSDTDLTLDLTGRHWIVFAGEANLPDGELATAPVDDGVDGRIAFDRPFFFAGRRFDDLELTFEAGLLTEVSASTGRSAAAQLFDTDPGARRIGELGVGVNADMKRYTGDLFFDEKLLGTVHIALGRAYPECGGTNQSALHWDIVKDLRPGPDRPGGSLLLDGEPIIEAGRALWI